MASTPDSQSRPRRRRILEQRPDLHPQRRHGREGVRPSPPVRSTTNSRAPASPCWTRGFRALKVWLALRHAGAAGYRAMISDDIRLSRAMAEAVERHAELQLTTQAPSIATFRYVPQDLRARTGEPAAEQHLDALNRELLDRLQRGGEAFVSNAIVGGRYVLRACIVNFHTGREDVEALPGIVAASAGRWTPSCARRSGRGTLTMGGSRFGTHVSRVTCFSRRRTPRCAMRIYSISVSVRVQIHGAFLRHLPRPKRRTPDRRAATSGRTARAPGET